MEEISNRPLAETLRCTSEPLCLDQVASILQVSPKTVRQLVQGGELVVEGDADSIRMKPTKLADYLDRVEVPAAVSDQD